MSLTLLTVTCTFLLLLLWQCLTQCFWMQVAKVLKHSPM